MPEKEIIDVDYGIASSYDDGIEINRKLTQYPKLRNQILAHELKHTKSWYDIKDFKNDFQSKEPYFLQSLVFALKNREAWINFFPLMYSYHFQEWTYNFSALIPFIYFGLIFWVVTFLVLKFLIYDVGILTGFALVGIWFLIVALFNGVILLITHREVKKIEKERREAIQQEHLEQVQKDLDNQDNLQNNS